MKIDSTKLFDEMLKENVGRSDNPSTDFEKQINEQIKESIDKMQKSFNEKLENVETRITNMINEKENKENDKDKEEHIGDNKDFNLSSTDKDELESECNNNI